MMHHGGSFIRPQLVSFLLLSIVWFGWFSLSSVQARLPPIKDVATFSVQTDVEFFESSVLQLKIGQNQFAWGLFNDGEDEIEVKRLRIIVSSDGVRYDSEIREYSNLQVKPNEELSVPWQVTLGARSYPKSGSIQAVLEMRDEDGKQYESIVLDKKCRFPVSDEYGLVSLGIVIVGTTVLGGFVFFIVATSIYRTDRVADFIDSRGDFSALTKQRKH